MQKAIKNLAARFVHEPLWRDSGIMFVASVFVNIFNLLFWLIMVRQLVPEQYAVLNSLVALMSLFSVPLGVVQTVVTRYVSRWKALGKTQEVGCLLKFFAKRLIFFSIGIGLVFLVIGRNISVFMQLPQGPWMLLVVLGIVSSAFLTLTMGVLYGSQRFLELSLDSVLAGVVKLLGGWFFVSLGWAVLGGLLGFIVGFIVFLIFSGWQTHNQFPFQKGSCPRHLLDRKEIYRYFLPTALCVFSLFALTNMDMILVKHFFSPLDAGHYAVAQIIGRIVLFLPSAVGVVMFPKIAEAQAKRKAGHSILKKCLAIVAILCGAAFALSFLFPGPILKILTGQQNIESVGLVKWFAFSMSFYAVVNIFALYFLSLHENGFIFALTATVCLQAAAFWMFHEDLTQVLAILSCFSVALSVLGFIFMRRSSIA